MIEMTQEAANQAMIHFMRAAEKIPGVTELIAPDLLAATGMLSLLSVPGMTLSLVYLKAGRDAVIRLMGWASSLRCDGAWHLFSEGETVLLARFRQWRIS
jgi:hypothetical protein